MKIKSIECAALASWPALEEETRAGWLLRFAKGYTKRANSVNAGATAQPLTEADIAAIEARFEARGLPPIFRLVSDPVFASTDELLIARGYRFFDLSLVMTASLDAAAPSPALRFMHDAAAWLDLFQAVSGKPVAGQDVHLEILRSIQHPCAYAVSHEGDIPVCCGLAVVVDGRVGLFDIATRATHRGRGLARELCRGLLDWARTQGASEAYLQVVGANTAAVRLYESLGYRYAYHYWYRVAKSLAG
ncbi:GNAT family N-acetyltransferase [Uliginosibacterium sp. 31-16]|uniref:GNAT family N-acetyltransferase n=1 Tax=Uliginosibacterium sp. 31-16 TaxID=3068315 RepID=UPI00273DC43A|nr:GNAT family N-acetyltransferase [Uliginosibacterium sp. 31-16]MDP5238025.1 GNAT family N-acetyltransferase [Uliginosibacterium sp. 31-16]